MAKSFIYGGTTAGASVTVYWYGTTSKPTIYDAASGSAIANPITVGPDGSWSFWVEDGHYTVVNGSSAGDMEIRPKAAGLEGFPAASDITVSPFMDSTETSLGPLVEKLLGGSLPLRGATLTDDLVLPKTSGVGIKVDTATPTFGWADIIGDVRPKTTGGGSPALETFIGGQTAAYCFLANDVIDFAWHIPHDYVPGTDLYVHIHWAHNGTNISGSFVVDVYSTYAKGHNQANFAAEKNVTITVPTPDLTTVPQYRHRIDEVQLSSNGGSATLLDSSLIEVDGLIICRMKATTIPTITGGSTKPFILFADLHYQTTGVMGTKQKAPSFYT